jgi:hypothetical protein
MDNIITLEYPNDTTAVIISGDNSTAGFPKERLEINTDFGTIIGDNFVETQAFGFEYQEFFNKTYECMVGGKKYDINGMESAARHRLWRQSLTPQQIEKGYYYDTQIKVDKGHYNELEFFRNVIEKNLPVETGVVNGAAANIIAWRAIESWEQKIPVTMDLIKMRSRFDD